MEQGVCWLGNALLHHDVLDLISDLETRDRTQLAEDIDEFFNVIGGHSSFCILIVHIDIVVQGSWRLETWDCSPELLSCVLELIL